MQDMQARNLEFKVLTQKIDTSTPEGRLFFHMTAAFDQFQRELIVENTRAGLAAARNSGRKGGRPRAMDDEKVRLAEAMLRDTMNYPFVNDVIKQLEIGRAAFYRYFHRSEFENSGHRTTEMNAIPVKRAQIAGIGEVSGNFDALSRKQRRLHGQFTRQRPLRAPVPAGTGPRCGIFGIYVGLEPRTYVKP